MTLLATRSYAAKRYARTNKPRWLIEDLSMPTVKFRWSWRVRSLPIYYHDGGCRYNLTSLNDITRAYINYLMINASSSRLRSAGIVHLSPEKTISWLNKCDGYRREEWRVSDGFRIPKVSTHLNFPRGSETFSVLLTSRCTAFYTVT